MTDQTTPGAVKPGWTTSEFWQTLLVQAITAIVAIGTMFKSNFNLDGVQAIVPAIAVLAAAVAQAFYSHARASVKSAAQTSAAKVASAKATAQSASPAEINSVNTGSNGATQLASRGQAQQPLLITLKGVEIVTQD